MVPEEIPVLDAATLRSWKTLSFPEVCANVLSYFIDETEIPHVVLHQMAQTAYSTFTVPEVLPLRKVGDAVILETFWGPTAAFKDIGMRMLAQFLNYFLSRQNAVANVLVETSGDTGPAAVASVQGLKNINVFCMYPYGKVSRVQELQLTTMDEPNVVVFRTHGTSDDQCQLLKKVFKDHKFCDENSICSMNSINIGRVLTQCTYYIYAYLQTVEHVGDPVSFLVPTGAGGNATGGTIAKAMGVPIEKIYACCNSNDVFHRTCETGEFSVGTYVQTLSPAMDTQYAYNLERVMYITLNKDTDLIRDIMKTYEATGKYQFDSILLGKLRRYIGSCKTSDEETLEMIAELYKKYNYEICPHSAISVCALRKLAPSVKTVCVATAHACKFEDVLIQANNKRPVYTPACERILNLPEKFVNMKKTENWESEWIQILKEQVSAKNAKPKLRAKL